MQMYVWPSAVVNIISISGGANVSVVPATFGAPAGPSTLLSAPFVVVTPALACDPLPDGSLAGAIAIVDRGTCQFVLKAVNVQAVRAPAGFGSGRVCKGAARGHVGALCVECAGGGNATPFHQSALPCPTGAPRLAPRHPPYRPVQWL